MTDKPDAAPSRIAIKFGASSSSRPKPASSLGKRPRPQVLHADSDSEQEDERASSRHEPIAVIAVAPGAVGNNGRAGRPLSIPPRQASGASKPDRGLQGESITGRQSGADNVTKDEPSSEATAQEPLRWGLMVKGDQSRASDKAPGSPIAPCEDTTATAGHATRGDPNSPVLAPSSKTADDEALDALVSTNDAPNIRGRVIHTQIPQDTEEMGDGDAFRQYLRKAPEASTLDEYGDMPVEEFGGALLRGMGWDGKLRGPKMKDYQRRPNQMGLGAKSLNGREDLGSWSQKTENKSRPRVNEYNRERREKRKSKY